MNRVLLVGCGQLGSRHLQALVQLPQVQEIEIVDSRLEALAMGRERLNEVPQRCASQQLRWLQRLEEATRGGAVCIVATQARGRGALVRRIVKQAGYTTFLIEKVVGQSMAEIEEMQAFMEARGCAAWVNFKTRAYSVHQRIKARLPPEEPITVSFMGGNLGLANNGVHGADLFAFYDGATEISLAGSAIDPVLHPSKRGADLFDLSGILHGVTPKGSHVSLSYTRQNVQSEFVAVGGGRYRAVVDHFYRWAMESEEPGGWTPVPFNDNILVSHMTKAFVADLLASGRCQLPTLAESMVAHRFILGALQPAFSELLERPLEACPVS